MKIIEQLKAKLDSEFGGALKSGKHKMEDGACCALELACAVRECAPDSLSDNPAQVGLPDFRGINDSVFWASDASRTESMLPMIAAYWNWRYWSEEKKIKALNLIVMCIIQEIYAPIFRQAGMEKEAAAFANAKTFKDIEKAAQIGRAHV